MRKAFDLDCFLADKNKRQSNTFYSVPLGRKIGIFLTWEETKQSVNRFPGAKFKKFSNINDAVSFFQGTANSNSFPYSLTDYYNSQMNLDLLNADSKNSSSRFCNDIDYQKSITQSKKIINIFCNGSVPNNGMEDAHGGIGIVFGKEEFSEIVPKINGDKITNNVAELFALKRVFEIINEKYVEKDEDFIRYRVFSTSEYSINSITSWNSKKWDEGIKNSELIYEASKLYQQLADVVKVEHLKKQGFASEFNKASQLARMASKKIDFKIKHDRKTYGDYYFQEVEYGVSKKQKIEK